VGLKIYKHSHSILLVADIFLCCWRKLKFMPYLLTFLLTNLLTYLITYLPTYLLTYLLHGTESFFRS